MFWPLEQAWRVVSCLEEPLWIRLRKEGDIAIFEHPGRTNVIKRVAELAPGSIYVQVDSKNNSLDSRALGSIHLTTIQAKAITVISEKDHIPRLITH
jgi:hypothetical protein